MIRAIGSSLVITDVLMPVMDGYELVRQLRLDPATRDIPVLFYTAPYGEREARVHEQSGGRHYVLTKPAEPADVLAIIARVLSGQSGVETQPDTSALTTEIDREHLRLLTDEVSEEAGGLRTSNARLRALINIGMDLASERDPDRLLERVCAAAHDLFGATYVTMGLVEPNNGTVQRFFTCGTGAADWIAPGDAVPGILRTVVTERRTLRGDNPGGDPASLQLPVPHPEVLAFLAAPVASPSHIYGWTCLVGNEGRSFTEDDEHLFNALSAQVGRIYESVALSVVARKRAQELEQEVIERKQAEAAVRHERDRAQRYLDTAEVILLALDLDGRITLINRKGCHLLGWTESELLGRNWIGMCLPERIREAFRQQHHDLIRDALPENENAILTKSGEERVIEWCNTLLRDDGGHVIGSFSSGTDITRRYQATEALRTAEERMRFALEAASVGIWDMDYTTGVLRWSAILESQYGLQPGTFNGTLDAFLTHVHPQDRDALRQTMAAAKRSGADFSLLHRAIWPDGTVRWLSGGGRVHLGPDGEPVRAVGITMDVTERRALEEQYQQAQKMEAVGRLASGVAHDFNNLLTVILGYCELLLTGLDPADPREADIVEIQKAGTSAAVLTRQLLAFSRKQIIEPTLLDLNLIVANMRAMLGRLIGEDVKIVMALASEGTRVKADRGQIEQIVVNLAVNARDAMPRGGTLTIETANVELDEHAAKANLSLKPGPYVVLTVTDTGTGLTPEARARLFEPFFTTKEPDKGTGLGLATVHGIATRSGGSVEVSSDVGRGASFKVYLPQVDAAEFVNEPPPVARPRTGTQTILVVDDDEGLRMLAQRLLQRQGYTVLLAGNADEALRVFERHASIDVLLTDVIMPGASGPELTRQLIERRPMLTVVYMSGYTEDAIARHGVLNPGVAFLHKPFTSETLCAKIREALDRESPAFIAQPR